MASLGPLAGNHGRGEETGVVQQAHGDESDDAQADSEGDGEVFFVEALVIIPGGMIL